MESGSRLVKPKPPLSDRIRIVDKVHDQSAPEKPGKEVDDRLKGIGEGKFTSSGFRIDGMKRRQAFGPYEGTKTDYLYLSFVTEERITSMYRPNTLHGLIILPYTVGLKIDTGRLERYAKSIEQCARYVLSKKQKPLIVELPLDYFTLGAKPAKVEPVRRSPTDTLLPDRSRLSAHRWVAYLSSSEYSTIRLDYRDRKETKTVVVGKDRYEGSVVRNFYLSDRVETSFDKSRVGKSQRGRYIITETYSGIPDVVEILSLDDKMLVTRTYPDRMPIRFIAADVYAETVRRGRQANGGSN